MADVDKLERALIKSVRQLRITESLLFLNMLLAVSRGELDEPSAKVFLDRLPGGLPPFIVHLIVKYLMRYGRMNTPIALDGSNFPKVLHAAFELAIADPLADSSDGSVHGYFVRMMSQQMKRHITAQSYGLAIGLFQDLDAVVGPKPIDLRKEVEGAIGMSIEMFMRIGQAAHAATCAQFGRHRLRGTLDVGWLTKAAEEIPSIPWLEKWPDFVRVTANDQRGFNAEAERTKFPHEYAAYTLSPLRRRPLIRVDTGRFIAVDPWLVVERTSWGVFYDIFEKYQATNALNQFTIPFGFAFERFVDNMLQSAIPNESLWRETESSLGDQIKGGSGKNSHQIGDLAYRSKTNSVLIECASLRPTRDLLTMSRKSDLDQAAARISEEVLQTFDHIRSIQTNKWIGEGLAPGSWVSLVITFGRFETVNGVFFRQFIDEKIREKIGSEISIPYLVLSLEELDAVIRLVESGKDFGSLIANFASQSSFDPLAAMEELRHDAVSLFARTRMQRMFDFLPEKDAKRNSDAPRA